MLDKINRFIGLYLSTLGKLFKISIWVPLLIYAILQAGVVLLCANFIHPSVYAILKPLVGLMGDRTVEVMGHYPGLYLALPAVTGWGRYVLGVLFEGLIIGAASVLFVKAYSSSAKDINIKMAFRKWLQLLLVWCIISALILAVDRLMSNLVSSYLEGSPRRIIAFSLGMKFVRVGIYSLFIYSLPSIIVYGNGIFKAIKTSLVLFKDNPIFSYMLALVPFILSIPFSYVFENAGTVVSKFTPELILYTLLLGIAVDMIVNFLITGTVVKFLLDERR